MLEEIEEEDQAEGSEAEEVSSQTEAEDKDLEEDTASTRDLQGEEDIQPKDFQPQEQPVEEDSHHTLNKAPPRIPL